MPKKKRDKKVSLTQTQKKGLQLKQSLIEEIQECVEKYERIFTFSVHNMRNSKLKDVRQEWKDSRFFFGKNKVMAVALGKTPEDEAKENLHLITSQLKGQTGLLFTNRTKKEVVSWFNSFRELDYARSGNTASQTVVLEAGPLKNFSHAMEPGLRKLGLPTRLEKGTITLEKDFTMCTKGQILTPEQAQLLKLFCHQMAEFFFTLGLMWSRDGKVKSIDSSTPSGLPASVTVTGDESKMETEDQEDL